MARSGVWILVTSVVVVAVLLPIHFFTERGGPTTLSTVVVLGLFFVPPVLAATRLPPRRGSLIRRALAHLGFGILLGVLVGGVGGAVKLFLHQVTGEPLGLPPATWVRVAALFVVATGLGYGVLITLARGASTLVLGPSPEPLTSPLAGRLPASRWAALLLSVVPGLGHVAVGRPSRGRPFLLAAMASGLAGLVLGIAGVILLVEGGLPTLPLLAVAAALVCLPLGLVVAAGLDLLFLKLS